MIKIRLGHEFVMQFIPWDPLQLDKNIDSRHGISLLHLRWDLFSSAKRRKIQFIPSIMKNGVIFSDDKTQFITMIQHFLKKQKEFVNDVDYRYYCFSDDEFKNIEKLENTSLDTFKAICYPDLGISNFLDDMTNFRDNMKDQLEELNVIEPITKRLSIIFLRLTNEDLLKILTSVAAQARIENLLQKSYDERVFLILMLDDARIVPDKWFNNFFDAMFFIGDSNMNTCEKHYHDLHTGQLKIMDIRIGTSYTKEYEFLIPLYDLNRKDNQAYINARQRKKDFLDDYEEFLESLDDGDDFDQGYRRKIHH